MPAAPYGSATAPLSETPAPTDPERQLALAYAPASARAALALVWQLDERMGAIVAAAREPAIGAMRLMWWRDALAALDAPGARAPAEPLLIALEKMVLPRGATGVALGAIEEGWSALLDEEEPGIEAIMLHGRARGGALFAACATLLGADADGVERAGEGWALADLGHRLRSAEARGFARARARALLATVPLRGWPAALRAIGLLAVLAKRDAAMPVEVTRQQGSPGRVLRAFAYGLTGR